MLHKLTAFICTFLLSTIAFGQIDLAEIAIAKKKIDSFSSLLKNIEPDSVKVNHLLNIANWSNQYGHLTRSDRKLSDSDYSFSFRVNNQIADSVYVHLYNALRLSKKIHNDNLEMKVLQHMGNFYTDISDWSNALKVSLLGLQIAESRKSFEYSQLFYNILMNSYFYYGDFTNAMKIASKGLLLSEQKKEDSLTARFLNIIGFIHFRQNNIAETEQYYIRYLFSARKLNDSMMIADASNSMGEVFVAENKFDKALEYYQLSLSIYTKPSIIKHVNQRERVPYTLFKIGKLYGKKGEMNISLKYLKKCLDSTKVYPGNLYDIAEYYNYTGNVYNKLNKYDNAASVLHYGLALSKQIRHSENIKDAYKYLSELFAGKKMFDSALFYTVLFNILKDSISNEKTRKDIANINDAYQLDKKNHQIEQLNQQKKLQEAEIRGNIMKQNIIVGLVVLLSIVGFLMYKRYQLRNKAQEQEEINLRQNELFNISTTIQDQERKRIAQDLHDGLGSLLSAAKLKLSALQTGDEHPRQMKDILHLLDDAVTELRNISQNIMPAALSKLGLEASLQGIFNTITSVSALSIHFSVHGLEKRLETELEISIFRIVLELINIVVKHASARNVTVQIIQYPDQLNITVEDDGNGFNQQLVANGTGLNNIRSRIAYLKGSLELDSREGQGTTTIINLIIPD